MACPVVPTHHDVAPRRTTACALLHLHECEALLGVFQQSFALVQVPVKCYGIPPIFDAVTCAPAWQVGVVVALQAI